MEQKTAKVFGNWLQECILLKRETTKQNIIETVHKLEQNSALKLTSTKYIPGHFGQTQLGLQEVSPNISAPVYAAAPVELPRPSPRGGSGNRTPGSGSPGTRPYSPGQSRSSGADPRSVHHWQRPTSGAGQRPTSGARQGSAQRPRTPDHRSTSNHSYKSAYSKVGSRNNSTGSGHSLDSPHRALQKHTIYSQSSRRGETVQIPSQFRLSLTPKSRQFLDVRYYIRHKNSEKFKDVMKNKQCLRLCREPFR